MKRILHRPLLRRRPDLVVVVVIPLNDTPIVKFLHVVNFLLHHHRRRRRHNLPVLQDPLTHRVRLALQYLQVLVDRL